MRKRVLSTLLAMCMLLALLPLNAFAANSDFDLHIDGNGTALIGYNGPGGDVVIPDGVTSISEWAFRDCTSLTSVTIPSSVTRIDDAFEGCTSLTSVTIPSSVVAIEDAFKGCSSLTSVTIPSSLTHIGQNAFSDTPWRKGLGDFFIVNGALLAYQGNGGSVIIPSAVTTIKSRAFEGCTSLTSVTIPGSVGDIGYESFKNCTNLTAVAIPDGVTLIKQNSFEGCTSLTSVTIPDSVTAILNNAFKGCTGLTSITIPNSVTGIYSRAFEGCTGLTNITLSDNLESLGMYVFEGCTGLTSITLPESTKDFGVWAFANSGIKDIYYAGSRLDLYDMSIGDEMQLWDYSGDVQELLDLLDVSDATIHFNSAAPSAPAFIDVPSWCADAAKWASDKGIAKGYGNRIFGAGDNCTNAQILTFLWRAAGEPAPAGTVSGDEYYAEAAQWAAEQGLTDGFSAEADCTRAMVVTYLWKLAGSPKAASSSSFTDVPDALADAVSWAAEQGITTGTSETTFSPDATCTRGQIVTFLYRDMAE